MIQAQSPGIILCFIACVVVVIRWNEVPARSASWAMMGFGLSVFLGIAVPISQVILQPWIATHGDSAQRMMIFTGIAMLWSALRGVSYLCLLFALYTRRTAPEPSPF